MALAFFLLLACLLLTAALQLQGQVITVPPQVWTNSPSSPLSTVTYKDGSSVCLVFGGGLAYTRPSFAAGFYCASPCESFLFAVFLATDATSDLPAMAQVVWTPNRDRPVHANATLSLRTNGGLVLLDADGSLVWSTNTTGKAVGGMTLTDSGNLMLLGWKNKAVWQSFDHPADSLVPGQSLAEGMKLTPTASPAASEQFYLTVLSDGLYAFVGSSPPQLYYRMSTSETKSRKRPTYVVFRNGSLDIFVDSSASAGPNETINLQPASSFQYMRFEDDGHLRLYEWQRGWAMVQDVLGVDGGDCGYPTVCGEYGICLSGQCTCPFEANTSITYFRQIDSRRINLGCEPVTAISCQSIRDHKLLVFPNVSYFDYIDPDAAQPQLIDEESCKQACLRNCSCKAALFMYYHNTSDGSCYLPSRLFSLQVIVPETVRYYSTSYIKVQITQPPPSLATPVVQTSSSGYLAPEWLTSQITEKADVYSFGVVIMEVIGGRKNLDRSQPGFLASKWLTSQITEKEDIYSFGVVVMEVIGGRKNLDSSQLGYTSEKPYLFSTLQHALADALWLRVTVLYFTCLAPRIVPQPCLSPLGSG